MRYLNAFPRFTLKESKSWSWQELKGLTSRFDSLGIFREEEEEAYDYIIKNGLLYDFFPEQVEKHLKKYDSLSSLKSQNEPLYNAALKKGILTNYFPSEISLPVKKPKSVQIPDNVDVDKATQIYRRLDSIDKNLDEILNRYRR